MSFKKHDFRYDFEVCCPYNKKHQMPFSKLWFHISKGCKDKRDKGHKYKVCPYNSLHIIILSKWESHVQKCLTHNHQQKNEDVDDIFKEMQQIAAQQFGNKQQQQTYNQQHDQFNQSAISSITYKQDIDHAIPSWNDTYDSQSEVSENERNEYNEISQLNYETEQDEYKQQKNYQYSSNISKSFQSSGTKSKKYDDDDYYD